MHLNDAKAQQRDPLATSQNHDHEIFDWHNSEAHKFPARLCQHKRVLREVQGI